MKAECKVLHVGKFYHPYGGGIETFMRELLGAVNAESVRSLALVHSHERFGEVGGSGREADGTIEVWRVPCWGSVLYAPVSPGFLLWLEQAIETFRPDVLHIHMPNTSAFWALASVRARRIPWVIHWHADVITSATRRKLALAYRLYAPLERALLHRAKIIVATSPPYLSNSAPLHAYAQKCRMIPLGLDISRFGAINPEAAAWATTAWGGKPLKVLAIGRLSHYKGYEHLIAAANHMHDAQIVIAGDGEHRRYLEQCSASQRVGERVTLAGYLADENIRALLASCDVFCLPSVEKTEAFGMVLLEAMRFSRPVVASRLADSGMTWVVQDGETGLLAEPRNPRDLAEKIHSAARMPQLGIAGRQRLESHFDIRQVARQVAAVYRDVMSASARRE